MSPLPKLGIRLHGGLPARRCAEVALEAERAGLDTVWFAENQFARGILPAATAAWFAGLGVLQNIPFNYLAPDEKLLPVVSTA